jgi:hypothetical protein
MAQRLPKTLVDYLVIAISPALIMTLIGSLVFFLLEVFYEGPFEARLKYVFTLYVFAAVLVGRIAIEEGREHARLFALPLAAAALVVLLRFVESAGPLSLILVLVILWCADKLTWDCTVIDERQRDTGKGLLQVAGLDRPKESRTAADAEEPAEEELEGVTSRGATSATWWKRLLQRRRRPHAPGVSVVYFSLAALPLFGIGELLTPSGGPAQRQALCFLLIYVASGLGLLLTTSFLGLRRYLRQRRVEMPNSMAAVWLAIGCTLIVAVLIFAALLPRPDAKHALSRLLPVARSEDQKPSRYAVGSDGVAADQGQLHSDEADQEGKAASAGNTGGNGTQSGDKDSQNASNSKQDGQNHSHPGPQGKPDQSREEPPTDASAQPRPSSQTEEDSSGRAADDQARRSQPETESVQDRAGSRTPQSTSRSENLLRSVGLKAASLLKWLFYIAVALVGIYWLWRCRADVFAALRAVLQGWREFWQNLFAGRGQRADGVAAQDGRKQRLPRPFAAFADPFATGMANRCSSDELVRYSFEALEAWAREHDCPRRPDQTPHEFARVLGARVASLAQDARSLADLYCRVAYAPGGYQPEVGLSAASAGTLKQLWQQLRSEVVAATGIAGQ